MDRTVAESKRRKTSPAEKNIDRYGIWLALFTWLPIAGDLFAIALGFYKVNPWLSAIYMLIGRLGRFLVWIFLYLHFAKRFFPHIS